MVPHITSAVTDDGHVDKQGIFHERYVLEEGGHVLMKPDGYISAVWVYE